MHELGLAAEILRIARETVDARGGGRLESVTVVVGDLSAVEPDLGEVPERAEGSWLRLCPRCLQPLVVEGGNELEVRTITFAEGAA